MDHHLEPIGPAIVITCGSRTRSNRGVDRGPKMITIKIRRHHLEPTWWRVESIDQAGADYPTRLQTHDIIDSDLARRLYASDRFRVLIVSTTVNRLDVLA